MSNLSILYNFSFIFNPTLEYDKNFEELTFGADITPNEYSTPNAGFSVLLDIVLHQNIVKITTIW